MCDELNINDSGSHAARVHSDGMAGGSVRLDGQQAATYLERPISHASTHTRVVFREATEQERYDVTRQCDWYFEIISGYNQTGYDIHQLVNIFERMPSVLEDALKQCIHSLRVLSSLRTTNSTIAFVPQILTSTSSNYTTFQDSIWNEQTVHAYVRINFHPETQERRDVAFNEAFANLIGLHTEELAARIGNREISLLASNEIDFLGSIVHFLLNSRLSRTERYGRMCGMDGRVHLVRVVTLKDFDSAGRLSQVI